MPPPSIVEILAARAQVENEEKQEQDGAKKKMSGTGTKGIWTGCVEKPAEMERGEKRDRVARREFIEERYVSRTMLPCHVARTRNNRRTHVFAQHTEIVDVTIG